VLLKSVIFLSIRLGAIVFSALTILTSFSDSVIKRRIINTGLILNAHFGVNLMNIHVILLAYTDKDLPPVFKTTSIFIACLTLLVEVVFSAGIRRFLYIAILPPAMIVTTALYFIGIPDNEWMIFMIYPICLLITLFVAFRQDRQDREKFFRDEMNMEKSVVEKEAKLKDEFISNVRHELRTPMNGIVGIHQLLKKTDLTKEQEELLEMAEKSSSQLSNMIEELLDISTMDQRTITLKLEEVELYDFFESVFNSFQAVGKKEIEYRYNFNGRKELTVTCDQKRLYQVVSNLLGNAEKFTAEGMISLDVDILSENDSCVEMKVAVTDTGIGIPQDKIVRVFDRFYQVDSSTSKKFKGTGLGLAISKRIIEAMGGKIVCNSIEAQGSVFFFIVRLRKGVSRTS
jgi:signal transduction histidine kinase